MERQNYYINIIMKNLRKVTNKVGFFLFCPISDRYSDRFVKFLKYFINIIMKNLREVTNRVGFFFFCDISDRFSDQFVKDLKNCDLKVTFRNEAISFNLKYKKLK
jgi:hypothetical protein